MQARLAVISDVHGNAPALDAALSAIEEDHVAGLVCLGDSVGYGASPHRCVERLLELGARLVVHVRGNHEEALFSAESFAEMNPTARKAILWSARSLAPSHRAWLARCPGVASLGPVQLVHDNPIPATSTYLRDATAACQAFRGVASEICLVGHTHVPLLFETTRPEPDAEPHPEEVIAHLLHPDEPFALEHGRRYILNPGSVGQPRDGDPRASYGVLDLDQRTFTLRRVEYDVAAAQRAMQEARLPDPLAERLAIGA